MVDRARADPLVDASRIGSAGLGRGGQLAAVLGLLSLDIGATAVASGLADEDTLTALAADDGASFLAKRCGSTVQISSER